MEATSPLLQEGTSASDGNIDVPAHDGTPCSTITEVLSRVGDKWSMQVVMRLGEHPYRFNVLRREIDGISQRMLTRTLRGLERDGLVSRTVTPSVPPQVEYALTALGQSLCGPVGLLGDWAVANREAIARSRIRFDAEG